MNYPSINPKRIVTSVPHAVDKERHAEAAPWASAVGDQSTFIVVDLVLNLKFGAAPQWLRSLCRQCRKHGVTVLELTN